VHEEGNNTCAQKECGPTGSGEIWRNGERETDFLRQRDRLQVHARTFKRFALFCPTRIKQSTPINIQTKSQRPLTIYTGAGKQTLFWVKAGRTVCVSEGCFFQDFFVLQTGDFWRGKQNRATRVIFTEFFGEMACGGKGL